MSITRKLLAGAVIAFTLFGCKSGGSTPSASAAAPSAAAGGAPLSAGSGGARKEEIVDPSLNNMNAVEVTVPAAWHFQGTLMQGGNCVPTPFPVFRVTSPDGLSAFEREPTMGWRWGTGPMAGSQTDCLPLKGALGAQAFLKYLAPTMHT